MNEFSVLVAIVASNFSIVTVSVIIASVIESVLFDSMTALS